METGRGPNYRHNYTKMLHEKGARHHTWRGEREAFYLTKVPVANATQRRSLKYEQWLNDTDRRKADVIRGGEKTAPVHFCPPPPRKQWAG